MRRVLLMMLSRVRLRCAHILGAALILSLVGPVQAAIEVHDFEDPAQRERYRQFIAELRCPKCQNQNLAGSDAPIAQDLRRELARLLAEGRSDEEIIDFMVQRYGDFVLYRPPLNVDTLVLWGMPLIMLAGGLLVVGRLVRRQRRRQDRAGDLPPDQRARAARLLAAEPTQPESQTSQAGDSAGLPTAQTEREPGA